MRKIRPNNSRYKEIPVCGMIILISASRSIARKKERITRRPLALDILKEVEKRYLRIVVVESRV